MIPRVSYCKRAQSFFNFSKVNFANICLFIKLFYWISTFLPFNLDSAVNTFYDALHKSNLDFVPYCHTKPFSFPHWFTNELKQTLSLKKKGRIKSLNPIQIHILIKNFLYSEPDSNTNQRECKENVRKIS